MADSIEIGTATDYSDLLDKLVTFATGTALWTELENTSDKVVLQGEGSGSEEIIVAIQKYANVGSDIYGWNLNGYTGWVDGLTFVNQPGAIPNTPVGSAHPRMPLWDDSIPYWFNVNSRRIIVVAKVSTVFVMCYLGFILPFATPGQYPYPLFIGGTTWAGSGSSTRFSSVNADDQMFWRGGVPSSITGSANASFKLRTPSGVWRSRNNQVDFDYSNTSISEKDMEGMWPYIGPSDLATAGNSFWVDYRRPNLDGTYTLTPIKYIDATTPVTDANVWGELDGIFHVTGSGNSSENIITVDGVDYLVVQNIFRSDVGNFCAVRLS